MQCVLIFLEFEISKIAIYMPTYVIVAALHFSDFFTKKTFHPGLFNLQYLCQCSKKKKLSSILRLMMKNCPFFIYTFADAQHMPPLIIYISSYFVFPNF